MYRKVCGEAKTPELGVEEVAWIEFQGAGPGLNDPVQPFYFSAFSRALSRDLYRAAVFSCRTPF
jgi:hypothetical protein